MHTFVSASHHGFKDSSKRARDFPYKKKGKENRKS